MANKEIEQVTGALAERKSVNGRRRIRLSQKERRTLAEKRMATAAVALFLDLDEPRSYKQIAEELGLSVPQLKNLTKTTEFDEAYSEMMVDLGTDPRYKASKAALADALPQAIRAIIDLASGKEGATPNVRLRAAEKILVLNGMEKPSDRADDRSELAKFLADRGTLIINQQVNNMIPEEFTQAMQAFNQGVQGEIIEGQLIDTSPE